MPRYPKTICSRGYADYQDAAIQQPPIIGIDRGLSHGRAQPTIMEPVTGPRLLDRARRGGLTDDVFLLSAPARTVRAYLREAVDRLAGADPGLTQLRTAVQSVLGIVVAVGAVSAFTAATGALQRSGSTPAVAAYNHATLIVSMLIAGIVAMMAGFVANDATARGQIVTTLILPLPMIAALTVALTLGRYRVVSLVFLVILLAVSVYVRRWGPRGTACGLVTFNGGFLGFFLHRELAVGDLGWLAADLAMGVGASLLVRLVLLRPEPTRTLLRMRRSWTARVDGLLTLSIAALRSPDPVRPARRRERMRRQVVRLNESTLMIDAQLVTASPHAAGAAAQALFDAELAVTNCSRFAAAIADISVDQYLREVAAATLLSLQVDDAASVHRGVDRLRAFTTHPARVQILAHRLGASVADYAEARRCLSIAMTALSDDVRTGRLDHENADDKHADHEHAHPGNGHAGNEQAGREHYVPAVTLNAGYLPGSAPVSDAASTTRGRGGLLDRATMPTYVRATIQIAVAGTLAIVLGDLVSGQRLYWAVIATFLAFMATTNSGEQVRKALFRVAGTALGIVVGDLMVHLTGGYLWTSLLIVLVALFFGIYLLRVNYTFMVIGITVAITQLYKQLGEFSWHLLVVRLGETAIGVGCVVVTVTLIVPLRPQRVLTTGVLMWFQALTAVQELALDRLVEGTAGTGDTQGAERAEGGAEQVLRPAVRRLDASFAALEATAAQLRGTTFGRHSAQVSDIRTVSAAARGYARSLAAAVESAHAPGLPALAPAAEQLRSSTDAIEQRIETGRHGTYVRCAALVESARHSLSPDHAAARPALRDLTMLDGALARLAVALHMDVRDHDTSEPVETRVTRPA